MSNIWYFTVVNESNAAYRVRERWLQEYVEKLVRNFQVVDLVHLKKNLPSTWCSDNISEDDVIIISGYGRRPHTWLKETMGDLWNKVVKVWNLCDNYLSFPGARDEPALQHIQYLFRNTDHLVTSSKFLQKDLSRFRLDPIYIVQDPVSSAFQEIQPMRDHDELRLLWHGSENGAYTCHWNKTIFDEIKKHRDKLPSKITLKMVTGWTVASHNRGTLINEEWMSHNDGLDKGDVTVVYEPWLDEEQAQENYKWADFVIIPVDKYTLVKKMQFHVKNLGCDMFVKSKSPNRVTEAIAAGVPVIASNIVDSYWEFRHYTPIVRDDQYITSIINCLQNKESTMAKLHTGQNYIKDYYSFSTMANQWKNILRKIGEQHENVNVEIVT